jgi:long-chain acyl-CoA synthetase
VRNTAEWSPAQTVKYEAGKPAISDNNNALTFEQLHQAIDRCATSLAAWQFPEAAPVALVCSSTVAFPVAYFGCQRANLVSVPMDVKRPQVDILQMMRELHVHALLCDSEHRDILRYLLDRLEVRLFAGIITPNGDIETVVSGETGGPVRWSASEKVEAVAYSAGTTGNPHGIIQTTRRLQTARRIWMEALPLRDNGKLLVALPVCHPGLQCGLLHALLSAGLPIRFADPYNEEMLVQHLESFQPTVVFGMPELFAMMNRRRKSGELQMLNVRFCASTGSRLMPHITEEFEEQFKIPLLNYYGTVGSAGVAISTRLDQDHRPGNMGYPISGGIVEIVGEGNAPVTPGEVGEIRMSGPHVTNWRATGDRPQEDKWLYTRDLAKINDDGTITYVCRRTDVINKGGYPVVPQEVEEVLSSHDAVQDVAIVGVPDPERIEELKGFVVLRQDMQINEAELIKYCSEQLPKYKCPRYIQFVRSLPKNYINQVLRKDLRKLTQMTGTQEQ